MIAIQNPVKRWNAGGVNSSEPIRNERSIFIMADLSNTPQEQPQMDLLTNPPDILIVAGLYIQPGTSQVIRTIYMVTAPEANYSTSWKSAETTFSGVAYDISLDAQKAVIEHYLHEQRNGGAS